MNRSKLLPHDELKVLLWGIEIGRLTWNAKAGRSHFFFSPEYFQMKHDIAPIIAPKGSVESHYAIYGNTDNKIYQKLPPFIADSLPDDWGNTLFDQWFNDNGYAAANRTPIAKLSFIGKRAMGAFEFEPCSESGFDDKEALSLEGLYSLASKIEEQRGKAVIQPEESLTKRALIAVGTSAGGRFKKAIIATAPDGSIHSGQTGVNPDWKYHIIKFNNPILCQAETEKTYYDMATDSGIIMMNSDFIEVECEKHFRTERYDRLDGKKILSMSLAAINPDAQSYEDLFITCNKLCIPRTEMFQLYRRMVFNILASNTDDHAKNFSFIMNEDGTWHIAPAYDINFIFRTLNAAETDHCFSMRGKINSFSRKDLILFAKEYDIKAPERIIDDVRQSLGQFETKALQNGIRGDITELISRRLRQIDCELYGGEPDETEWPSFTVDGHSISSFRFEKDEKGAFRIVADIDGKPSRKIISAKNPDYLLIAEKFNNSSPTLLKRMVSEYLLKH